MVSAITGVGEKTCGGIELRWQAPNNKGGTNGLQGRLTTFLLVDIGIASIHTTVPIFIQKNIETDFTLNTVGIESSSHIQ